MKKILLILTVMLLSIFALGNQKLNAASEPRFNWTQKNGYIESTVLAYSANPELVIVRPKNSTGNLQYKVKDSTPPFNNDYITSNYTTAFIFKNGNTYELRAGTSVSSGEHAPLIAVIGDLYYAQFRYASTSETEIDTNPPVITGQNNYQTKNDNPISINQIKKNIKAQDNIDGDVTNSIKIVNESTTYNPKKNMDEGEYIIKFSANDTSGNISYYDVTVLVTNSELINNDNNGISSTNIMFIGGIVIVMTLGIIIYIKRKRE